jgi:serine/threonine protein kinase/Tol biopolymer transport system component
MSLVAGVRLGAYEIVSALGAGGMGEVYRARDTKLRRDVAIKVLPAAVRLDPERLTRFEREALVLASLNHPNIASIFGVEEAQGVVALVLELIEGDTLAARIARGPIAVGEALNIARQIAEALETAHEKGVVHRDLKPANISITPTGLVKVLDFGLAKIAATADGSADETQAIAATEGMVIGTAAYMSPEQARGQAVDRRTDIWAFGCVLYEMLTGQRLFAGSGTTDTLALVFTKDPDWSALPPQLPPAVRALLKRCLERDRQKRIGDVAAIRFALEDVSGLSTIDQQAAGSRPSDVHRSRTARRWLPALFLASITVGIGSRYLARFSTSTAPALAGVTHLTVVPEGTLLPEGEAVIALSPDGRRLAYVAGSNGRQQVYLRELDQFVGKPIPGTEGAMGVTFSLDGNWLAFAAEGKIRKIAVAGGEPVELGDFGEGSGSASLSWGANDSILFSTGPSTGIRRIPAAGGMSSALSALGPGELEHHSPQILPGEKALLYSATLSGAQDSRVVVQLLETGQRRVLATGTGARYIPPGYLTYVQAGTMFVAPFDLTRLEITGAPTLALQGVRMNSFAQAQVAHSQTGSMAYLPASGNNAGPDTLMWVDRSGAEQPTAVSASVIRAPRVAPDLRRVAVALSSGGGLDGNKSDVWVYDVTRNAPSRVTFEGSSLYSIWSPDSTRLAYNSRQNDQEEIHVKTVGDSGPDKRLEPSAGTNFPFSWSPDGRFIAGVSVNTTGNHVWVYGVDDPTASRAFVETKLREGGPVFSQDGRWIAYASLKSSRNEIYMRPFPGPGEEWTISTDGGNEPVWARKTGQLFYRHGDAMMAVDITTAPTVVVGKPRKVFERSYNRSDAFWPNYDVSPDGQRFLMIKGSPPLAASRINVLLDWPEELKRLVPTK